MKYPLLDLLINWTETRLKQDRRATLAEEYVSLVISRLCYESDPVYCEIRQVADRSGLPYPSVARMMKEMCDRGALISAAHPRDARRTVYTPPSDRLADDASMILWAEVKTRIDQIRDDLPDEKEFERRRQALERTHRMLRIN